MTLSNLSSVVDFLTILNPNKVRSYSIRYLPLGETEARIVTLEAHSPVDAFRRLPAFQWARITSGYRRGKPQAATAVGERYREYFERIQK